MSFRTRHRQIELRGDLFWHWVMTTTTLILLTFITGCDVTDGAFTMLKAKSFHEKFGLRAEDFFDDAKIQQLCHAIERDDLKAIEQQIAFGADVNTVGKHGVTPLFWAFPDNKIDRFLLLLENGADPNVRITSDLKIPNAFRPGDTVMHLSARSQFPNHFLEVMKHGGDPNLRGRHDDCVIHELLKGGVPNPLQRIKAIAEHGGDINAFDHSGYTPIQLAVNSFSQFAVAIELLKLGADPTIHSKDNLGNCIHDVLAIKRRVNAKQAVLTAQESIDIDSFILQLRNKGYNVDEAQDDIDRWAKLASKNPGNPGWFRKSEIELAKKRAIEKANAKLEPKDRTTIEDSR